MFLRQLNIGPRLALGFTILILLMLTIVLVASQALGGMRESTRSIVDGDIAKTELAHQAQDLASFNASKLFQLFAAKDQAGRTGLYGDIDKTKASLDASVKKLASMSQGAEEAALLDTLKQAGEGFTKAFADTADLIEAENREQAAASLNEKTLPALQKLIAATQAVVGFEKKHSDESVTATEQRFYQATIVMWTVGGFALLSSLLLGFLMTRSILLPIQSARQAVGDMAQGKLATAIAHPGKDEVATLLGSLESMRQSLREIILSVTHEASNVATASSSLSRSSRQIADSSNQQSELTESIATSVDQLTQSAKDVAQSAEQTRQQTEQGVALAEHGQTLIHQAAGKVVELSAAVTSSSSDVASLRQRTEDIAGTVTMIRKVAEQTNLIALNAAIEAARAGEFGRGFAVVADEVRTLSVRASQATGEISQMIDTMQADTLSAVKSMEEGTQEMQHGVTLVQGIVQPLSELSARSKESYISLGDLVTAAEQQSEAADAILQKVQRIAGMASDNRDRVHAAAATSEQLDAMSIALRSAVSRFSL